MQFRSTLAIAALFFAAISTTAHAQIGRDSDTAPAAEEAAEPANTDELLAELDQLAQVATDETNGLLLAQEQAKAGEFLEALGTIERVLAIHPKSQSARLLHAVYLCQIDDLPGGAAEIGKLKDKNFPAELWNQAQRMCKLTGGGTQ